MKGGKEFQNAHWMEETKQSGREKEKRKKMRSDKETKNSMEIPCLDTMFLYAT
jgi:hypothetical protein